MTITPTYPDSYGDDYAPAYSTTYIAPANTTTYAAAPYRNYGYRNYGYRNYAYRNYGYGVRHAGYGYGIRHGVGGYGVRHATTAPLTWEDRSDLAGTGADMLGRDMDVALGKPVLSHRVAEQAGARGNRPDAQKLDNTRAMINLTRPLNYRWGLFSFRS